MDVLTQKQLDLSVCGAKDCEHGDHLALNFHCADHVGGKLEVCYEKDTGMLKITCCECRSPLAAVKVARE